jgi:RNA ligase
MHYKFPQIHTINDVLPHIQGRKEFVVAEREDFGTVISYKCLLSNTFDMIDDNDNGGAIRRECRGLIFDKEGNIMSRPFHKFFNINEREETIEEVVEVSMPKQAHIIMEKMDGSMIRPLLDRHGNLRLGTKMGITDVANNAEDWLTKQDDHAKKLKWLRLMVDSGITPLFEWVSPDNQIILEYKEEDLVYLGSRRNTTGEYFMDIQDDVPFNQVPLYGSVQGNLKIYIDRQRQAKNREGDVIRFENGHMIKVKNYWYVKCHRIKSGTSGDHDIVNSILKGVLDDEIPFFSKRKLKYVRDFEKSFWDAFQQTEDRLFNLKEEVIRQGYGFREGKIDRKRIALEIVPTLESKDDVRILFQMVNSIDEGIHSILVKYISKNATSGPKWDQVAQWIGFDMSDI